MALMSLSTDETPIKSIHSLERDLQPESYLLPVHSSCFSVVLLRYCHARLVVRRTLEKISSLRVAPYLFGKQKYNI